MVTKRDVVNTIDVIINWLKGAINNSSNYVMASVEEHFRKFPADRGSAFVRNLTQKVVDDQTAYLRGLISNLLYMKQEVMKNPPNYEPIITNTPIATQSLGLLLRKIERGLDTSYRDDIENALANYQELYRFATKLRTEPNTTIPKGFTGWEVRAEGMWVKSMPSYELLVQQFLNKFYATVKDIPAHRVHSDSTPYNTLQEAMGAAVHNAAKLANTSAVEAVNKKYAEREAQRQQAQNEYKPVFSGKQGRLF